MPLTEEQISATMPAHPVAHELHTAYMREVWGHGGPEEYRTMTDAEVTARCECLDDAVLDRMIDEANETTENQ